MEKPLFRVSEILDMAVQVERAGIAFYESFRQAAVDPGMDAFLDYLIEQEHRHIDIFTEMREGEKNYGLPETYPGEIREYMDSFVKGRVFSGPEQAAEKASRITDPLEAVELAMTFEKRSAEFYGRLKEVVRASEKETVDRIIAEEHAHLRQLGAFRRGFEDY
ncbi:MAG: ferritin family protein [Deltaproteobacteria bacterium]|nr:ferritin family protein [Deltaproteobacteria bacterium]